MNRFICAVWKKILMSLIHPLVSKFLCYFLFTQTTLDAQLRIEGTGKCLLSFSIRFSLLWSFGCVETWGKKINKDTKDYAFFWLWRNTNNLITCTACYSLFKNQVARIILLCNQILGLRELLDFSWIFIMYFL